MFPLPMTSHDGPMAVCRAASDASSLSLPSPLSSAEDSAGSEGTLPLAVNVSSSMAVVDVIVDAVHDALKPEWNKHEQSAGASAMTEADRCVMRAIRAALQSPLECGDGEITCPEADARLSEAVDALASIEEGTLPATDGPWAQLIDAITRKLLLQPSVSLLLEDEEAASKSSGRGDSTSSPEDELVREMLSNTIWDYTGFFCDAVEEAGGGTEATRTTLRRISELTTTWGRAKDINRLGIMAFIVSFACQCDDE